MDIAVQVIGIAAMAMALLSFQQRTQKNIMRLQMAANVLFIIHYFLLGALIGGCMNAISLIRAGVYAQRQDKKWAASPVWIPIFIGAAAAMYVLAFCCFGIEWNVKNALVELLPVLGMVATTFAFRMEEAKWVRRLSLLNSPVWLAYNAINRSLGGFLTEAFTLISILVGYLRLDRERRAK